jgi:hypothetical protein
MLFGILPTVLVRCLRATAIIFGLLLLSAPALGQGEDVAEAAPSEQDRSPDPEAAKREEARSRFLKGVELVQNESWDAALAEFLASRELFPTQVALKNAAISLRQLKRNAEALEMYEELLQLFGAKLSADDKRSVDEAMVGLRRLVAEITISGTPTGAVVVVDGRQRGTLPLSAPVRVDAGTRHMRVFKEGYVPFETQLLVAGAQKKSVRAELAALAQSGKLSVEESSGKQLEVLVDGAVVGKTPWVGVLSVGTHTVLLRGDGDLGTPPTAADVKQNQTTTLRLSAAVLDTSLRVEPTPANARIDIDGVVVGNGVWEGRLKSGAHKVEVIAEGFLAYSKDVRLVSGQREVVRVALERDVSNPMWSTFRPHLYAELVGGLAFTGSLGGSAATACADGDCSDESHPPGVLAGARVGYQLTSGLGLEIFLGYLRLQEEVVRTKNASADVPTRSTNYEDKTTLSGPLAALSASYTFLEQTPVTARVWAGAMRGRAEFENAGTFSGTVADRNQTGATFDFSERVTIAEQAQNIWVPFVAPELRFGYRFNKTFALDLGVAGFFFFPPSTPRVDTTKDGQADQARSAALPTYPGVFPGGVDAKPGNMFLSPDDGFGAFVAIVPSVAARVDF